MKARAAELSSTTRWGSGSDAFVGGMETVGALPSSDVSVAAKKGTNLAGETEPLVRLRSGLLQDFGGLGLVESVGRAFSVGRVGRSRLPYGNFWLPLGNWLISRLTGISL
jgi:hypothetical protein